MRQRSNQNPLQGYQGGDNAALATLNILSNPSVVAAIVNAAKGDRLAGGQTNGVIKLDAHTPELNN